MDYTSQYNTIQYFFYFLGMFPSKISIIVSMFIFVRQVMRSLLFLFSVFAGVVLELYSLLGQLFCPSAAQLCVFSFLTTYHRDGLAMRPGLGRALARPDEPEGDEPRVSRLGSNSSISSTSSCSSTSWSRMHLTEYWPNTQSCERGGTCEER